MKKKILIINGHPDKESFCSEIARKYKDGADVSSDECKLVNLIDLKFNPNLEYGYKQRTELEPDLLILQEHILESDHLVFVYPTWWGTYPALLKGFIDRVFLPRFAFQYKEKSMLCDKLLKGKSARLIVTMDTPKWYYSVIYGKPGHKSMKRNLLNFCGIKPVKITSFSPVKGSDEQTRQKWLKKIELLGYFQN